MPRLVYRALADLDDDEDFEHAAEAFERWVGRRWPLLSLPEDEQEGVRVRIARVSDGNVAGWRGRLGVGPVADEETVTVTLGRDADSAWLWLDREQPGAEADTESPFAAPALGPELFAAVGAHSGKVPFGGEPHRVGPDDVDWLADILLDPDRYVPVVVMSTDTRLDRVVRDRRAQALATRLVGAASLAVIETREAWQLGERLGGERLWVSGGAIRTYLPGLDEDRHTDPLGRRHRFVNPLDARDEERAATEVTRVVGQWARELPLPPLYLDRLRFLPGFLRPVSSGPAVPAAAPPAPALEAVLEDLHREVGLLRRTVREVRAEAAERDRIAERLTARLDGLDEALRREGVLLDQDLDDALDEPDVPGCEGALVTADARLENLVINPASTGPAQRLDAYPEGRAWGARAWRALRALHSYVEAKRAGVDHSADFGAYCRAGAGPHLFPAANVVPIESDAVRQDPAYRRARIFAVDPRVDPSGEVFMESHIRIGGKRDPAPRLHFFDDTSGPTGKVHVGYLGPHLRSGKTS